MYSHSNNQQINASADPKAVGIGTCGSTWKLQDAVKKKRLILNKHEDNIKYLKTRENSLNDTILDLQDAATSGLDYQEAYYDKMYKNATARNSMISAPQNNVEKKSVYDDSGIPPLTSIEKWLLEDPSAPLPQVLSTPAPAPVPLVFPAPALVPQFLSAPASAAVSQVFHVPAPTPLPQVPPTLTPVEKWLLENTSAPVHQLLPALVSAPVPQVFPAVVSAHVLPARASAPFPQVPPAPVLSTAPGHEGHDQLLNMFTPFRHGQILSAHFTDYSIP